MMHAADTRPVDKVLAKLENVKARGDGHDAFCPAHGDDKNRHLHVSEADDGRVLVDCKHGCTFAEIMGALGLELKEAFPMPVKDGNKRRFSLRDHTGKVAAIHHREDREDGSKRVWWTTPDGTNGLGQLKGESLPLWGAEAVRGVPQGEYVVVCEGEKAASYLTYRGIPAVGTVTGASGTPSTEVLRVLAEARVVLWPDNDEQGKGHMRRIGKMLVNELDVVEVLWFEWEDAPEKGDAADHPDVKRGKEEGLKELRALLQESPRFIPKHDPIADGAATFAHVLPKYEEWLDRVTEGKGVTGLRTGIPKIDQGVHGLEKGLSYMIAARPNVGKSMFLGQIALTIAQSQGRVLLVTPDQAEIEWMKRWAPYMTGINHFQVRDGLASPQQKSELKSAAGVITKLPVFVDGVGTQTVERIRWNIERHEPDILIVDYLQKLTPTDPRASRTQQVGQISRELDQIKSDYDIPVVIGAQLNRGLEHRQNREPVLADLRDSGEIEQDADVVLMMDRPQKHDDISPDDEEVWIHCRKNRMGQIWSALLYLEPGQVWLTDKKINYVGKVS